MTLGVIDARSHSVVSSHQGDVVSIPHNANASGEHLLERLVDGRLVDAPARRVHKGDLRTGGGLRDRFTLMDPGPSRHAQSSRRRCHQELLRGRSSPLRCHTPRVHGRHGDLAAPAKINTPVKKDQSS